MTKKQTVFKNKVYDEYLNEDYVAKSSTDLNPQREIELESAELVSKIQAAFDLQKKRTANLLKDTSWHASDETIVITDAGMHKNAYNTFPEDGSSAGGNKQNESGSKADHRRVYTPGGQVSPEVQQAENLYSDISDYIAQIYAVAKTAYPDDDRFDMDSLSSSIDLHLLNCSTTENLGDLLGSLSSAEEQLKDAIDLAKQNGGYETLEELLVASAAADTDETDYSSLGRKAADTDIGTTNSIDASARISADYMQCVITALSVLRLLMLILAIIMIIKMVISIVMTITSQVTQMLSKATQVWVNPPSAADLVIFMIQFILALLKWIIMMIIKALWDSLNLTCAMAELESRLDWILKILGIIKTTISQGLSIAFSAMNAADSFSALKDAFNQIKDTGFKGILDKQKDAWLGAGLTDKDLEKINGYFSADTIDDLLGYSYDELIKVTGFPADKVAAIYKGGVNIKTQFEKAKSQALEAYNKRKQSKASSNAQTASESAANIAAAISHGMQKIEMI